MKRLYLALVASFVASLLSVTLGRAAAPVAPDYVNVSWVYGPSQFLVRWFPVPAATSYNVYRYDTNTSAWTAAATNLSFDPWNVLSFRESGSQDAGLTTYAVTAVNGDGESSGTSGSVTPGLPLSSFTCYSDYWPRGFTFIEVNCQGSWLDGTMGMVEVSPDGTNFTHGVWTTNITIAQVHQVTNLPVQTTYTRSYVRHTYVDTNGTAWGFTHPWDGVYTLPLTNIDVWEDMENEVHIGDYTWYVPAQILTPPAHGTLVLGSFAHQWFYRPDTNFTGIDTFEILDNPSGPPLTITLNVQDVNEPPISEPFTVYVPKNASSVITPPVYDLENDFYMVYIGDYPTNGYVDRYNDTNFIYTPLEGFTGTDHFTYMAHDTYAWNGIYVMATVIVTNANTRPVTDNQSFTATEDTPLTFTVQGSDYDNDPLSIEIVNPPLNGSITSVGLTATYTPGPNHCCDDYMSFRVNDGQASSELYWIFIYILPVNDPPVANPASATVAEDSSVVWEFSWTDVDSPNVGFEVVDLPQHGTALDNIYWPAANYFGTDTFTYRVFDGESYSAPATVTVTVTPVNDLPRPDEKVVFVDEDQSIADILSGTDVDGDTLTFSIVSPPQHGTFANGVYTPDPNFFGTDSLRYDAFDGTTHGDNALLTIVVNPINDPPVADDKSVVTGEDTSVNITLTGVDVDYDQLTFSVATPPQYGQFIDGVYTPAANYFGPDSFTYKANDGQVDSAPSTVTITVLSANDEPPAPEFVKVAWVNSDHFLVRWAPVANATGYNVYRYDTNTSDWLQIATNLQVLSVPLFRDPGVAAPVTYAVRALNSEGLGAAATGSLTPDTSAPSPFPIGTSDTWKIARSYVRPSFVQSLIAGSDGMVEIRIAGSNEFFAVSWKTNLQIGHIFEFTNLAPGVVYEVQVTAVSGASIGRSQGGLSHSFYLEPASATLQEDTSVAINLGTQTAEVLQILTQPSHGTLTPLQDGRWTTYTPAPNFFGTDAFQILDHTSGPPVTVTVTVQNVNDAPVAQPITIYVAEDSQAMFPPVVFDIENDPYVFGVSINAAHGDSYGYQFTHLVYIPYPDFVGQDEFWYYAADESEGPPALVTVIVTNINDQPLVVDQYIEGLEDTATNITLVVTDVDPGDTHTFEIVDAPAFGTLTGTAPNLTYTPNANFGGSDTFTYRVSDGQTNSALGTITLLIFGVNDAPTAQSQSVSTAEDTALPIVLSGSDPDGDFVLYIIDPYPAHGILNLNGAPPDFEYIPDANYHGSDSFTFRTWDGYLQSAPATVSITITPVNDAPVVDSKSVSVNEDGSVAIALTGSDADGDNLTFAVVDPPQHGQFAGGVYTPVANYNGPDSFTYKANDGQLDSAPATVSITINPVNDAPVANAQSVSTAYNTAVNITLNGADIEGSALTFSTLTSPANGTLTGAGANRTFTPDIGWSGTTSFAFKVNDGELDSATATVTITVASPGSIPAAPSGLTATAVSQTQINLAWTDNSSNEDGFKIERSPNGNSSWSQIATVGPNITTYSNTGLNKNTRYHYRVRAYNVLGNSAYSNTANARTLN